MNLVINVADGGGGDSGEEVSSLCKNSSNEASL